jgi:hypothetical protein
MATDQFRLDALRFRFLLLHALLKWHLGDEVTIFQPNAIWAASSAHRSVGES